MSALKRIIAVLGSHRSGTSTITKGLEVVGASLGSRLMAADYSNERGYWEDVDIYALNREMLASTGRDWHHLSLPDERELALLRERYFERASRLLAEKTEASDLTGLKDPRFCLLLPFWSGVFASCGVEASYVLALRHPASVEASLAARDSLPKAKSDWIWILHMLGALAGTANSPRIIVDYEELIRNPAEQIGRLADAFRLQVREDLLPAYQESYLDASLNHHASGGQPAASVPLAMEIHKYLHRIATDRASFSGPDYEGALAKWQGSRASAQSLLDLSGANDLTISELGATAASRLDIISGHERRIELLSSENYQLTRVLEAQEIRERETLTRIRELKEDLVKQRYASSEMQRALASVEVWQQSWFRRAFGRWHMLQGGRKLGFFRRLERSVRRRRKKLLSAFHPKDGDLNGRTPASTGEGIPATEEAGAEATKTAFRAQKEQEFHRFLQSGGTIALPRAAMPKVSVILVLYNQAPLTLACLRSLELEFQVPLEVVIVDNASTDQTGPLLERIHGATVLSNGENLGFLKAVNQAAEMACGEHLLLLNNDAIMRQGSLARGLKTLESTAGIGAVGGRLILANGLLQEAGSMIWSDASCLGYGRGLDAEAGEAMFRRDVDYCSGACLLTPRALWNRLGGLTEAYAPAYYEDTDYCMRLRAEGHRVVYEPAMVADHFEFGSEVKAGDGIGAMLRNRDLFLSRHRDVLQREHLPPEPKNVLFARCSFLPKRQRLLVIDADVPQIASGSGYPRTRGLLAAAHESGWFVTLYPLHRLGVDWESVRFEIPWEVEIVANRAIHGLAEFLQERAGYYDVVMVSRPENMALVRTVLRDHPRAIDGARLIYDSEALSAMREILRASMAGRPYDESEARARIDAELELANTADAIVCVSEAEADAFRRLGVPVHILTHSVECASNPPPCRERGGFLFVGRLLERDSPNWNGLAWFVSECWPLIRASLPAATLTVAGQLHPQHDELKAAGVRLLGGMADLTPLYDSARVFIAPVHFAAGVPVKILEAAAAGLPVAGTRLMARQVSWEPGTEIAAEDEAEAFAAAAVALHEDRFAWESMRTAQARVKAELAPKDFKERLQAILGTPSGSQGIRAGTPS